MPLDAIRSSSGLDDAPHHQLACRLQSTIEVNRRQNCLQGVHQQGCLVAAAAFLFASSQVQVVAQLQFLGHSNQMPFADQVGTEFGEFALSKRGQAVVELFGGDESEDRVPEELQLFVVSHARAAGCLQGFEFACLGAMGQGLLQQLRPLELVPEAGLQERNVARLHGLGFGLRTSDIRRQPPDLRPAIPEAGSEVRSPTSGFIYFGGAGFCALAGGLPPVN